MAIPLLILSRSGQIWAPPLSASIAGPSLYQPAGRHRTLSAGLAFGGAAIVCAALATALVAPDVTRTVFGPTEAHEIRLPPPEPDDLPPPPKVEHRDPMVVTPRPEILPSPTSAETSTTRIDEGFPPLAGSSGTGSGTGTTITIVAPPPIYVGPRRNPRFADDFQPPYPSAQERERVEGRCPVSVTVSPAGRVTAVRDNGCTDAAFFRSTERQALRHWRFEPATRGGVAVESTLTQTVVFRLPD